MKQLKVKVKVTLRVKMEVEVKFLPIEVHPLGLVIEYAKHLSYTTTYIFGVV